MDEALESLLRKLEPVQVPGRYVFATLPAGMALDPRSVVASVREAEGLSVVVAEADARAAGLASGYVAAWITLAVDSALEAVGLTAAVSAALAQADISCNVVAGHRHDHLFVPHDRVAQALAVLQDLQSSLTSARARA